MTDHAGLLLQIECAKECRNNYTSKNKREKSNFTLCVNISFVCSYPGGVIMVCGISVKSFFFLKKTSMSGMMVVFKELL